MRQKISSAVVLATDLEGLDFQMNHFIAVAPLSGEESEASQKSPEDQRLERRL